MSELLPCPFCGCTPTLNEWDDWDGRAQVCCENDDCPVSVHTQCDHGMVRDLAIAAWNTRATNRAAATGERRQNAPTAIDVDTAAAPTGRCPKGGWCVQQPCPEPCAAAPVQDAEYSPAALVHWLRNKYARHHEIEDELAADYIAANIITTLSLEAAVRAADARVVELEKDAARFRWLRTPRDGDLPVVMRADRELYDTELDAAIDAARAQVTPEPGK